MSPRDKATEAESLTIFGARGNQRAEPSLARRGLMAAGGLLLLVVAVAVWALYFNTDGSTELADATGDPVVAAAPVETATGIAAPTALAPLEATPPAQTALVEPAPEPLATEPSAPETLAPETLAPTTLAPTTLAPEAPAPIESPPQTVAEAVTQALTDALTDAVVPPVVDPVANPVAVVDAPAEIAPVAETPAPVAPAPVETAVVDPDRLLDTLVQEALNEALPADALDRASLDQGTEASADLPATVDPGVAQRLSLPRGFEVPATTETAFAAPLPPLPFGSEVTLDANGLIEATPEGAITPSGVTVVAGRPPTAPAPRPRTVVFDPPAEVAPVVAPQAAIVAPVEPAPVVAPVGAPVAEAVTAPPAEPQPPAEVVYDDTPRADPALAGVRPLPRSERVRTLFEQQNPAPPTDPGAVVPQSGALETPAATTDTATLETPPPGGVSLAALRPLRRPTDLVPAPAAPVEGVVPLDTEGATPEAVAASIRPSARPSDVAERARAALAAATTSGGSGGSPEEVEDQDGETASSATADPVIPSSASVARQATETDAIRLNQANLIGVFGTPSDRRALVRLSSGRVVRLQVGDRLDGGQVTAISADELRYVKNGRNEILRIGG